MNRTLELIMLLTRIFVNSLPLIFIIIITVLIVKGIKRSSARDYELRKYKAETERIKAEAERAKAEHKDP